MGPWRTTAQFMIVLNRRRHVGYAHTLLPIMGHMIAAMAVTSQWCQIHLSSTTAKHGTINCTTAADMLRAKKSVHFPSPANSAMLSLLNDHFCRAPAPAGGGGLAPRRKFWPPNQDPWSALQETMLTSTTVLRTFPVFKPIIRMNDYGIIVACRILIG